MTDIKLCLLFRNTVCVFHNIWSVVPRLPGAGAGEA